MKKDMTTQARKLAKDKDAYQSELDFRVLGLADMLTGRTKKYQNYSEFFETLGVPVGYMPQIKRGERHFGPYHLFRLRVVHNISEVWLLTGEGDIYGHAPLIDKLDKLEERVNENEKRIKELEILVGKKSGTGTNKKRNR